MFDPWQEPTDNRQETPGDDTLDLNAETEAEDPAAPHPSPGEATHRELEPEPSPRPVAEPLPASIGRYRVSRRLGYGGFGSVYLAHDEQLDRQVAVKVPHARLVRTAEDAGPYLAEARAVAQLDHPNIVPVYDVGSSGHFPFYIVSKYVDAETLATRIRNDRPGWAEGAGLLATIAEALDHAHVRGLVHRDVKPGNILIDPRNVPYVVDFGLALRDTDQGTGPRFVGTPAYMSPEQAWGEGHRVDRRSDIFSLGVVLYELICGVRPFSGSTREAMIIRMTCEEPRPPSQVDGSVPAELQRICLKALAKRAADRYSTAKAMADEIRLFLAEFGVSSGASRNGPARPARGVSIGVDTGYFLGPSLQIVPKGLRSFNERDTDFFLQLLPGPRDRDDLPDSLRFWKDWIERGEPGPTGTVGLIYGPSGCGKTSLVKAGLIPRLDDRVLSVYVEATPDETESRLLAALRRKCPALPEGLGFRDCLSALRRGRGIPDGSKVLLVVDQFEQWLHARRGEEAPALVQDLRQCDGDRVQCLVMVRDDFWMAATRFMRALEVPLVEGRNSASVDLFDPTHARRVLAAFGRAYGKLDDSQGTARERDAFLDEAVRGLAQEGKVVCVRLALFAEMMKSREWSRATLSQVGGARGVGFTFLEENFGLPTSPPAHLQHEKPARAVLASLLPESGTDIKGHMRSEAELMMVSGYSNHPEEFEKLIRILDSELRLITPTDPEGIEMDSIASAKRRAEGDDSRRFYQLTHDYLVHSVSDWLTRKQRESRRGRAELCLQERALLWSSRPASRFLPSIGEWLNIGLRTDRHTWSDVQRQMMRTAGRRYGILTASVVCAAGLLIWACVETYAYYQASLHVGSIRSTLTSEVSPHIQQLAGYRRWADPLLRTLIKQEPANSRIQLNASLALLESDESQVHYLAERLVEAQAADLPVIREALFSHRRQIVPQLWYALRNCKPGDPHILSVAAALALYDESSPEWDAVKDKLARELVASSPIHLAYWLKSLRPIRHFLVPLIAGIVREPELPDNERVLATNVLIDYATPDYPRVIADLLMDAEPSTFNKLVPVARTLESKILPLLREELEKKPGPPPTDPEKRRQFSEDCNRLAARQARAAVVFVRLGRFDQARPFLVHSADPRLRSELIVNLKPLGLEADPHVLIDLLDGTDGTDGVARHDGPQSMESILFDPEISVRRAALLVLGQFELGSLDAELKDTLPGKVLSLYRDDPDSGIHGAAEWALRRWNQTAKLEMADRELVSRGIRPGFRWFMNSLGMTLCMIEGPVEFWMGSPPHEPDREEMEVLHRRVIPRRFAIGCSEVSFKLFQQFLAEKKARINPIMLKYNTRPGEPACAPSWYEAAEFCDWLSAKEGLKPCYEPGPNGEYAEGMKILADLAARDGYRLPFEGEWEYSCRAGTRTSRYCGTSPSALNHFGWSIRNSDGRPQLCSRLMPNDLGLFDSLGSLYEWCQDVNRNFEPAADGRITDGARIEPVVLEEERRILRGGSFGDLDSELTASRRIWNGPMEQLGVYGFRIARTMPPR